MNSSNSALQKKLLDAYIHIFEQQNSLEIIRIVYKALQDNTAFLRYQLSQNGTLVTSERQPDIGSSFSSIFLPFHIGQEYPLQVSKILFASHASGSLIAFMERCGQLEKLTEQFAYLQTESQIENKELIIAELEKFLKEFPSLETFKQWVATLNDVSGSSY